MLTVLASEFEIDEKDEAREFFNALRQKFIDWNYIRQDADDFKKIENDIDALYASKKGKVNSDAAELFKDGE